MSEAARSISEDAELLGVRYADHTTWCDFGSTRKTFPLPRPKLDAVAGLASLFAVSVGRELEDCAGAAGRATGSGEGIRSASFSSNTSPMRSVKMASASLGFVTTWNTCSLVMRLARYWSSPFAIGSKYTECTAESSAPP